ncbi:MAG: hypothetical protein M4579_005214 [Chaenotheca gracillima]|nr:MAG: hypothetical protein M4579_005214 [Chaenotheca gracillima]
MTVRGQKDFYIPNFDDDAVRETSDDQVEALMEQYVDSGVAGKSLTAPYLVTNAEGKTRRRTFGLPMTSVLPPGKRLAQSAQSFPGIHRPFVYISEREGAPFEMHVENFDLHSMNILHAGAPKLWCIIFPKDRQRVERMVKTRMVAGQDSLCEQFVRHENLFPKPSRLRQLDISFSLFLQKPGELVITLPGAYHFGFGLGANLAEATNCALDLNWDPPDASIACDPSICAEPTPLPKEGFRRVSSEEQEILEEEQSESTSDTESLLQQEEHEEEEGGGKGEGERHQAIKVEKSESVSPQLQKRKKQCSAKNQRQKNDSSNHNANRRTLKEPPGPPDRSARNFEREEESPRLPEHSIIREPNKEKYNSLANRAKLDDHLEHQFAPINPAQFDDCIERAEKRLLQISNGYYNSFDSADSLLSSLKQLKPGNWLNASTIMHFLESFSWPPTTYLAQPETLSSTMLAKPTDKRLSIDISEECGLVIGPLNWNNNHWTLMTADLRNSTLTYYGGHQFKDDQTPGHLIDAKLGMQRKWSTECKEELSILMDDHCPTATAKLLRKRKRIGIVEDNEDNDSTSKSPKQTRGELKKYTEAVVNLSKLVDPESKTLWLAKFQEAVQLGTSPERVLHFLELVVVIGSPEVFLELRRAWQTFQSSLQVESRTKPPLLKLLDMLEKGEMDLVMGSLNIRLAQILLHCEYKHRIDLKSKELKRGFSSSQGWSATTLALNELCEEEARRRPGNAPTTIRQRLRQALHEGYLWDALAKDMGLEMLLLVPVGEIESYGQRSRDIRRLRIRSSKEANLLARLIRDLRPKLKDYKGRSVTFLKMLTGEKPKSLLQFRFEIFGEDEIAMAGIDSDVLMHCLDEEPRPVAKTCALRTGAADQTMPSGKHDEACLLTMA